MSANKRRGSSETQAGQSSLKAQSAKPSAGKKPRAKPERKRKDVISLGQEKLTVRRGVGKRETIAADDLIVERLVHRALSEEKLRDIKELYRRCDAERASSPAKRARRPTASQLASIEASIGQICNRLWAFQNQLLELELAEIEDGALRVSDEARSFLRTGRR